MTRHVLSRDGEHLGPDAVEGIEFVVVRGFSSKVIRIIFWIILGFVASLFFKLGANVIKITLITLILWNFFSKGGRETLLICRDALAEGAKTALPVGVACAVVGIIIGTLTLTGIASS
ncbi:MAG: hypothetical protein ACKPKO_01315, partial [Candidatus Fonsibacter sp.]